MPHYTAAAHRDLRYVLCHQRAAEEDAWDTAGMSFGFGGIYVHDESSDSDIYYDWCGPRNTLRALHNEGLVPQYNVDQASWVPFVDSVTFTVAGDHRSLHTVFGRYVDAEGNIVFAAGEMGLRIALDITGPVTRPHMQSRYGGSGLPRFGSGYGIREATRISFASS